VLIQQKNRIGPIVANSHDRVDSGIRSPAAAVISMINMNSHAKKQMTDATPAENSIMSNISILQMHVYDLANDLWY
jgi:hypothetical protein